MLFIDVSHFADIRMSFNVFEKYEKYESSSHQTCNKRIMILTQSMYKEKREEIGLSPMTKALTPTSKFKKQRDNTKTPLKTSITQRLRTDLGRSVGVTIATQRGG